MYVIIVGAGLIGENLIDIAVKDNNEVVVIEKNEEIAKKIDSNFDCLVINSDATSRDALEEAGIERADALITTTEKDTVNLLVALYAGEYDLKHIVSVAHDPKDKELFQKIGVSTVENPENLIAQNLYDSIKRPAVIDFMKLGGEAEIFEIIVDEESSVPNKTLKEAADDGIIPEDIIIVAISRGEDIMIPKGNTELKSGDLVTLMSLKEVDNDITNIFRGNEH